MPFKSTLLTWAVAAVAIATSAVSAAAPATSTTPPISVPSLAVPQCPREATVTFSESVPDKTKFPLTIIRLCYDATLLHLTFTATGENSFFFNTSQGTNDDIWMYEVMEAFIYHGQNDPQTYLEFEVNPNNVTYQAFVFNPSKVRAPGAPFDHFFVSDPATDGFSAQTEITTVSRSARVWTSKVQIPLALFNPVELRGSQWRMNFFRTITSPTMFPNQTLGAWSVPDQPSFHMTPYFGNVVFV